MTCDDILRALPKRFSGLHSSATFINMVNLALRRQSALVDAAQRGDAPVQVLQHELRECGAEISKYIYRQGIGAIVKAVLDAEGYVPLKKSKAIVGNDKVNIKGATYRSRLAADVGVSIARQSRHASRIGLAAIEQRIHRIELHLGLA